MTHAAPDGGTATFRIGAGHPSLPGHFPGNAVVPGVVLLEEVLAYLPAGLVLQTAKFIAPVRPGEEILVTSAPHPAGGVAFTCSAHGRPVLRGTAALPR